MSAEQIAFHVSFASVHAADGSDPRERATAILREERVLAGMGEFDGDAATVLLPITQESAVVALDAEGWLRFDLGAERLVEILRAADLQLSIDLDDELDQVDADLEQEFGEAFERLDETDPSDDMTALGVSDEEGYSDDEDLLFAPEPVRVAEFSHRGPWLARVTAQLLNTPVDYLQAGTWSLYRYATDRAHGALVNGRAERPVIEVNLPAEGEAWIEVSGRDGCTAMFWPNAQRSTVPVLEIDTIAVPESAEVYRRLLGEAAGAPEELAELGDGTEVDAEAVLRACLPEALGGVAGELERVRTLVRAFGIPTALVAAGLDDAQDARQFTPQGWPHLAGQTLMGGWVETTSLAHHERPLVRAAHFLRKRPLLGAALSIAELALAVALGRRRSRLARGAGVFLAIDAIADLVIWTIRLRRR